MQTKKTQWQTRGAVNENIRATEENDNFYAHEMSPST